MAFENEIFGIDADAMRADAEALVAGSPNRQREHDRLFEDILAELSPIDFRAETDLPDDKPVPQKMQIVLTVQLVLAKARELKCGLCRNLDFVYAYNGEFWRLIDKNELERFLGEAAKRLGVDPLTADYHRFKSELVKQFLTSAYLPAPEPNNEAVLINLKNGTFEITKTGGRLREFHQADFLTYQLPFPYDAAASCPKWLLFLNEVIPDRSRQNVLAEFIGYVFARHLKLEKTLILYGTGANGKSVFFDVISALFSRDSISNISLESICRSEYHRAVLANKLLNFSPEISTRMHSAEKFKQLTSGEPIEARLPYGQPMILRNYARLAFNTNELPRDVEHSEAFFRRFLVMPFDLTIPEAQRNPNLAREIIRTELSGVFNWVLTGLSRLLEQNGFSECRAAREILEKYRRESDSVAMFLMDERYVRSESGKMSVKEIFAAYKSYCIDNNYRPLGRNNFTKRLEANGIPREDSYQPFFYLQKV